MLTICSAKIERKMFQSYRVILLNEVTKKNETQAGITYWLKFHSAKHNFNQISIY